MRFFKSVTPKSIENTICVGNVTMTHNGEKYILSERHSGSNLMWTIKYKENEIIVNKKDYGTFSDIIDNFEKISHQLKMRERVKKYSWKKT